ncbi:MAG: Fic family protein [Ignavibacteriaceae bacterium]
MKKGRTKRPTTKEELDARELKGLWRALAFSKRIAESKEKITLKVICDIHRMIFEDVVPEIAGRFRRDGEDTKKLDYLEPPPGRLVTERMYTFWNEFDVRLAKVTPHPKSYNKKQMARWEDQILDTATWTQYQIAAIHPFPDGNGRMARIMTNVVLRRFGLQETDVKYEGADKARYLEALRMVDQYHNYDQLKNLILRSMIATYKKIRDVYKRQQAKK